MRPIEFLHSIERLSAAENLQHSQLNDPYNATGSLTIKEMQNEIKLKQTIVNETEQNEKINPDGEKKHDNKQKSGQNPENEKESESLSSEGSFEPDKGNILDIIA